MGYAINWIVPTPEIAGKHSGKFLKNALKQKPTKNQKNPIPKYKLTGGPFFTFILPGRATRTPASPSVTPLPIIKKGHVSAQLNTVTFSHNFSSGHNCKTTIIQ